MILLFYVLLNAVAVYLFLKKKQKLHILETLVYWMVGSYLFQNFSALCYMNFKTLMIPDKLSYEYAHFLNRTVLFPLLMVTFLHFFLQLRTHMKKFLLIISFLFLFVGLEWLSDFSGVLIHVNWRMWWSYSYWLTVLLMLIAVMKLFRKILYKGASNL
jgi:hypothetical protein